MQIEPALDAAQAHVKTVKTDVDGSDLFGEAAGGLVHSAELAFDAGETGGEVVEAFVSALGVRSQKMVEDEVVRFGHDPPT
jgi:hypothetical protein